MFDGASKFNQDIGNWNLTEGLLLVGISMNTNVAMYESTHTTHHYLLLFFLLIFIYSLACLEERYHLTKTLVIGMFPTVDIL